MRARPSRMLQSRSLMAALSAAGALPELVTRCLGTLSNYQRHQGHRGVVQTLFAIDPSPAVAALKLPERRTGPWWLSLVYAATPEEIKAPQSLHPQIVVAPE